MNSLAIIGVIVGIIGIILIIIVANYNKYQWLLIKLNKGEKSINNALEKKYNILLRYIDYLKSNVKVNEKEFDGYDTLNLKMSLPKLDKKIEEMNNVINKNMDNNEKLLQNEAIINIHKELLNVNITVNGCRKYYNDNLIKYNHLCHAFPSNIIGKLFKYKEKEFLIEEGKSELKILENDDE